MEKKYTAAFYTLGCRVNQYETRAVEEAFDRDGFRLCPFEEKCDVYVINTCTVTAESDRKSRQIIRRAVKNGKGEAVVIVTGCMSQVNPETALKIDGVFAVVGNNDKTECLRVAKGLLAQKQKEKLNLVSDIFSCDKIEPMSVHGSDNTRAFLKIVDGCDNNCAYCIIPSARGHIRSKSLSDIVDECEHILESGCREIVFTGIETAAFGKDAGVTLCDLAKKASELPQLKRIRFGSLEPTVVKEKLVKELSEIPSVMPHFHLSLQSGSDAVLAKMRRKYNTEMFYQKVQMLKKYFPQCQITTDIIVGFPGETKEQFAETLAFVERCGLLYVHVFPYSDRAGTDASAMKDKLPEDVKKERAAMLDKTMRRVRRSILSQYLGKTAEVLWETSVNGFYHGYTENFIEVRLPEEQAQLKPNDITKVELCSIAENEEFVVARTAE